MREAIEALKVRCWEVEEENMISVNILSFSEPTAIPRRRNKQECIRLYKEEERNLYTLILTVNGKVVAEKHGCTSDEILESIEYRIGMNYDYDMPENQSFF